jgi:hypothetical protein
LDFKNCFDKTYNALLQPLDEFGQSLNTVQGMLAYVSLAKEINAEFDALFNMTIKRAQQQYPGKEEEMKGYVALLKQQFHAQYLPVKNTTA